MDLGAVLAEVMACAGTVDGLSVPPRWGDAPARPPVALVEMPEQVVYDSGGTGFYRLPDVPLVVVVGDPTRPDSFRAAARYASTGPGSVRAAVEAFRWTSCGTVRVARATLDAVELKGHPFAAVTFHLDITGRQ